MFCKNCGTQLSDGSNFCSNCGCDLREPETSTTTQTAEVSNAQNAYTRETITPPAPNRLKDLYNKFAPKLSLGGFVSAAIGATLFLAIVLISLVGWGEVYLFGGYDYTIALATISLILMILGFVVLTAVLIINLRFKTPMWFTQQKMMTLSVVLVAFCAIFSVWGIVDCVNEQDSGYSSGNGLHISGSSDNNYYSSGIDKSIGLSLKVDSIKKSGNYTYVYCSVTNVSAQYIATEYRYVKVKAQFKNYSGKIVDTDWTYAVDSAWLEPGETKTFYYMVPNTDIKSATLSFVD